MNILKFGHIRSVATIALVIVLVLAAYATVIKSTKTANDKNTINLGYVETGISGLMVKIILDEKIHHSLKLNINFFPFNNPKALNNAVVTKQVDVAMATGANAAAKMIETGHDVKYFFPNVLNSVSLLVLKNSNINSIKDLKGKKIGWYGLQTSGGTGLYLILKELGYNPDMDFKYVESKPPTLPPLLSRGDVDAIIIFEPFVSKLLSSGNYKEVSGPFWKEWKKKTGVPMELSGFVAYDYWLSKHKTEARRLVSMWIKAVDSFKIAPIELLKLHSRYTGIESDEGFKLAAERLTGILVSDWGDIEGAIGDVQRLLFKRNIYFFREPIGIIEKIEPETIQ
ncbi:MAG: ABC transporter substrate-binding protein [Magnetococcales bacterium]|nr:ABC transporter substrate-binding protein [Magnetococcales bacterium]